MKGSQIQDAIPDKNMRNESLRFTVAITAIIWF